MLSKSANIGAGPRVGLKALLIVVLALLFQIPLWMISGVISERSHRAEQVEREIAGKWATEQSLQGPFLIIPGDRTNPDSETGELQFRKVALLPDNFSAVAEVATETRSRGIFDSVVYTTRIKLTGDFTAASLKSAGFEDGGWRLRLDQSVLALGIDDLRGLQGDLVATWGTEPLAAAPGMPSGAYLPRSGITWQIADAGLAKKEAVHFEIDFTLRGSTRLSFVPVAKTSLIDLRGDWSSPSFDGYSLPDSREVGEDGFAGRWKISHLSRPLPQSWTSHLEMREAPDDKDWRQLAVGVSFVKPVDFYLLSERSVKYGLLIVALLFLTFFLFEVLAGIALHPLQYLMVGAALVLFFLGLIAFAEVLGFAVAYGLSGGFVATVVALYTAAILRRRFWAVLLFMMIAALYALIYVILNLEEVALLAGTLVLFAALGLTMYVTRRVDWYAAAKPAPKDPATAIADEAAS